MDKLIYSDTPYFYDRLQDLVPKADLIEITTDFKTLADMPERGKRLLRLIPSRKDRPDKMAGPVLDRRYQVSIVRDSFNRVRILVIP